MLSKPRKAKGAALPPPKNQRILDIEGRYGEESPDQLRIELDGDEYRVVKAVGGVEDAAKNPYQAVSEALTDEWQDADAIVTKLKVGRDIGRDLLKQLTREGQADVAGKGVRGDPFLYRRPAAMHPKERLTDDELWETPLPSIDERWERWLDGLEGSL